MEKGRKREEKRDGDSCHIKHKHRRERVASADQTNSLSDEQEMLCSSNDGCLRLRQLQSQQSTITSSSSSSEDSRCALCALHPHRHLSSLIPYFRTFSSSSESEYTPTSTPAPSSYGSASYSSPTSQSVLFSTDFITSSLSLSTTTSPPSSSSSEPPSSSSPPSSGFVFSTFTSSFVTEINGSPTTASCPLRFFHPISFSFLFSFFFF
jgi:hypothetical protein